MPPETAVHQLIRETVRDGQVSYREVFLVGGSGTDSQNGSGPSGTSRTSRTPEGTGRESNVGNKKAGGKGWGSRRGGSGGGRNGDGEGGTGAGESVSVEETEAAAAEASRVCTLVPGATATFEVAATAPEEVVDGPAQMQVEGKQLRVVLYWPPKMRRIG